MRQYIALAAFIRPDWLNPVIAQVQMDQEQFNRRFKRATDQQGNQQGNLQQAQRSGRA